MYDTGMQFIIKLWSDYSLNSVYYQVDISFNEHSDKGDGSSDAFYQKSSDEPSPLSLVMSFFSSL